MMHEFYIPHISLYHGANAYTEKGLGNTRMAMQRFSSSIKTIIQMLMAYFEISLVVQFFHSKTSAFVNSTGLLTFHKKNL